ncbi:hypothetical protein I4J45_11335 [Corynebacterium belfantii]|nr:hypothetical protein [Corynebacterium belfantii]MBG9266696.1 hypothetical protein [Corynebacterium belfantii]MBG9298614.1 hypothetical protein [Corynebacterium belfantii]MBG9308910.1 hypothetical protein [Corynebacterium belfantii]
MIELLWAMGYGGTNGKKKHVGQSNDGGIDVKCPGFCSV